MKVNEVFRVYKNGIYIEEIKFLCKMYEFYGKILKYDSSEELDLAVKSGVIESHDKAYRFEIVIVEPENKQTEWIPSVVSKSKALKRKLQSESTEEDDYLKEMYAFANEGWEHKKITKLERFNCEEV